MSFADEYNGSQLHRLDPKPHEAVAQLELALTISLRQLQTQARRLINGDSTSAKDMQSTAQHISSLFAEVAQLGAGLSDEENLVLESKLRPLQEEYERLVWACQNKIKSTQANAQLQHELTETAPARLLGMPQLQIQAVHSAHDTRAARLREEEERVLLAELQELHHLFATLKENILASQQHVQKIDENLNHTVAHVQTGNQELAKATMYDAMKFTLAGAAVGMVIGGPVGALALGLKGLGVAAAVAIAGAGGAAAGATAGVVRQQVVKKQIARSTHDDMIEDMEHSLMREDSHVDDLYERD